MSGYVQSVMNASTMTTPTSLNLRLRMSIVVRHKGSGVCAHASTLSPQGNGSAEGEGRRPDQPPQASLTHDALHPCQPRPAYGGWGCGVNRDTPTNITVLPLAAFPGHTTQPTYHVQVVLDSIHTSVGGVGAEGLRRFPARRHTTQPSVPAGVITHLKPPFLDSHTHRHALHHPGRTSRPVVA